MQGHFDGIPVERKVIHRQQIRILARILFDVELSFLDRKLFVIVRRRVTKYYMESEDEPLSIAQRKDSKAAVRRIKDAMVSRHLATENTPQGVIGKPTVLTGNKKLNVFAMPHFSAKTLWLAQAKQLIRLFNADMTALVNGVIKINEQFDVDFSFIDKVLTHMVGLQKQELLGALKIGDTPKNIKDRAFFHADLDLLENRRRELERMEMGRVYEQLDEESQGAIARSTGRSSLPTDKYTAHMELDPVVGIHEPEINAATMTDEARVSPRMKETQELPPATIVSQEGQPA